MKYEDAEEFEVVENSDGDDDVEPQKLTTVQEIETVNEVNLFYTRDIHDFLVQKHDVVYDR